jgi:hypothetical protein
MPPALSPTALAMTASELVLVTSARCRAIARVVIISLFRFPQTAWQAAVFGRSGILGVSRNGPNGFLAKYAPFSEEGKGVF